MRLTNEIALVGGGDTGFGLSAPLDCHIYVIDGGSDAAIVDAGMGGKYGATEQILQHIKFDGISPDRISKLLLTHYHADHAGGAADFRNRLNLEVIASPLAARTLEIADEEAISLPFAKQSGFYPADYVFQACPATPSLVEGHTFPVGNLQVTAFETPGHSAGHISFLVEGEATRYLVAGDLIFYGGTIIAQNIPDCSIQDYAKSTIKMAGVEFDALLPGHLSISLTRGKRHVDVAADQFRKLMIPRNAV
jgi:glyoxylase-like metal-dependent hydrolase (beta-lactamase superfamily II)